DVSGSSHPEIRQRGAVDQPVLARENFDKPAAPLRRTDAAPIALADLALACHPTDDLSRARGALAAGRVNVDRTIILDVNFCAGFGDDALDRFPARPDKRPDLLRINFDRLNPGRVGRELWPRFIEHAAHDLENPGARLFRL